MPQPLHGPPDARCPITVLLVGPPALCARLAAWLAADARCQLQAACADGVAALRWLARGRTDLVLVAGAARGRAALEVARSVMHSSPLPVVLCAELAPGDEASWAQQALQSGALAGAALPAADAAPGDPQVRRLLDLAVLMAEVRVVRRWSRTRDGGPRLRAVRPRLVGIGASTGGPPVLQTILSALPHDFALPILVVQHIAPGFLPGLAAWLQQGARLRIGIAEHATAPQPGCAYLAPDGWQMALDADGRIALTRPAADRAGGPSVASLFRSLAEVSGPAAVGVLLTGMGKDGAAELCAMKTRGAVTIAQDVASSVVHGMPGEAIALGGATHVLPADQIAGALVALARQALPIYQPAG